MDDAYQRCRVYIPGISLDSFVIWGAADDMPLSVYMQLEGGPESANKQHWWVKLMYYRRVQKGELDWAPLAAMEDDDNDEDA